jgi:NTP-dependent ternary system trypsin peptidase co-occuring protein
MPEGQPAGRTWAPCVCGYSDVAIGGVTLVARFVEVPLPDGQSLVVEAAEEPSDEVIRAGHVRELTADIAESFEAALDRVRHAACVVVQRMRSMESRPDEVSVEFAIKLGAEAGVVIARSAIEANLTVRIQWNRDDRV